jgi:hypothetical protein
MPGIRVPRWVWRHWPYVVVSSALALLAAAAAAELSNVFGIGGRCRTDAPVACGMFGNVLVAVLAVAVAYVGLFGVKSRRALRKYRATATDAPRALVPWAPRDEEAIAGMRRQLCENLADDLAERPAGSLVLVKGRDGVGKTTLLVALTRRLAQRRCVPIPISLREAVSLTHVGRMSREAFLESIDDAVDSEGSADAIWRWARRTRRIVVLVDDLDESPTVARETASAREELEAALDELLEAEISVVLTTSVDLGLQARAPVQIDLDTLDESLALRYLQARIRELDPGADVDPLPAPVAEAIDAVRTTGGQLPASALYHLSRIGDLAASGRLRAALPGGFEPRRTELLVRWLDAVAANEAERDRLSFGAPDGAAERRRRQAAIRAAKEVARHLLADPTRPSVPRSVLRADPRSVDDAAVLGLLQERCGAVRFPTGALHALFVGDAVGPYWRRLLNAARKAASTPREHAWLSAAVLWTTRHPGGRGAAHLCEDLVATEEKREGGPRPKLVATAARVASVLDLAELNERIVDCAMRVPEQREEDDARRALVDACARLGGPRVAQVLWHFCCDASTAVNWEAAKALIGGHTGAAGIVDEAERLLEQAHADPAELAVWNSATSGATGSLAWVLPTLYETGVVSRDLFDRTVAVCLDDMSPLQGEVALARGIKIAIMQRGHAPLCGSTAEALLLDDDRRPTFWLARLLLAQGLTCDGSQGSTGRRNEVYEHLAALARKEPHPLVQEALRLGREAIVGTSIAGDVRAYVWENEREAVMFPRTRVGKMSRLAGDAVLLSNLIYVRAGSDEHVSEAESLARSAELPRCLGRPLADCDGSCRCGFRLCDREVRRSAIRRSRAPFSAAFCHEQERVIRDWGAPSWDGGRLRRRQPRRRYWQEIASLAVGGSAHEGEQYGSR